MWIVFVVGVLLLLVNGGCTLLKETPEFWRNAGDYPMELRALVLAGYYPLLGINALLCGFFSVLVASEYRRFARCPRWAAAAGVALWMMWGFNVALLTANNVENVLNGRELHYHAPYP